MGFLKLAIFVCLLVNAQCVDKGYEIACAQTDTCTVTNTACNDLDGDHYTTCGCTASYKPNAGTDGCDAAIALGSTCTAATDCVEGCACVDADGAGAATTKTCVCASGYHASGTSCVKNPGSDCSTYGLPCTANSACVALSGSTTLQMTCQCNNGYYSDGVNCVAGASFVTASTFFIFAAFVASRLFF